MVLSGTVQQVFPERGFGFISVDGRRVFFHISDLREVEGTPDQPVITSRRLAQKIETVNVRTKVVLDMVQGDKGPKARVWGFMPHWPTLLWSYWNGHTGKCPECHGDVPMREMRRLTIVRESQCLSCKQKYEIVVPEDPDRSLCMKQMTGLPLTPEEERRLEDWDSAMAARRAYLEAHPDARNG